jgi:hypothetical protein
MNPEMLAKMRGGSFAQVTIQDDATVSGWLGQDLEEGEFLRLDGMILSEGGYLQQISLRLLPGDIRAVRFLPESPLFMDVDGNVLTMERGFFGEG